MKKLMLLLTILVMNVGMVMAQTKTVSGVVISGEDNQPIIGASVRAKGDPTKGSSTNVEGRFQFQVSASETTLVVTYVGMKPQEVKAGQNLKIIMRSNSEVLEELVVIGYGSGKKIANTSASLVKVSSKELAEKPTANVMDAVQGKVAGLQVYTSSGEPSATSSMVLHGVGSLTAGTAPLYVLDGMPVSSGTILGLNSNDFESVQILKDAAATSIYGARAANGVVYITTKKGRAAERAEITVRGQYGISNLANTSYFERFMNTDQLLQLADETKNLSPANVKYIRDNFGKNNTTWWKYYLKQDVPTYQADVNISGGKGSTRYYISTGMFNQEGIRVGSDYKKYNLRVNLNTQLNQYISLGLNNSLSYDIVNASPFARNSTNAGLGFLAAPWWTPYKEDGTPYYDEKIPGWNRYNPQFLIDTQPNPQETFNWNGAGNITIKPFENFTIRSQAAMEFSDYRKNYQRSPKYPYEPGNGVNRQDFSRTTTFSTNTTAEYKFDLGESNHFTALLGHEFVEYKYNSFYAKGEGLDDERLMLLSATTKDKAVSESVSEYAFLSYFGQLSYDYQNKYFLDFVLRNDASSRFGENNQNGTFWSVGTLWKAKQESFLQDVNWIDDLNLKFSIGTQGNASIGNYNSYATVSKSGQYKGAAGWAINEPGNPNLSWENQRKTTIGLSGQLFGFFGFNVEYYHRLTTGMLMDVPMPLTTGIRYDDLGFSSVTSNVGEYLNQGIDLRLDFQVLKHKDYNLSAYFNFNYNKDKIVSLFQGKNSWILPGYGFGYIVGEPVTFIYPLQKGVNPDNGHAEWYLPGEDIAVVTKDKTTDEFSSSLEQNTGIRRFTPMTGGFGLHADYKGFYLEGNFSFALGKHMISNDKYFFENPYVFAGFNQTTNVFDYWKQKGDQTEFASLEYIKSHTNEFTYFDSKMIEDASFLRLKTISLGYVVPKTFLMRQNVIKNAKIFVTGRNVLTFTKYSGPDPEIDSNLAFGNYPNSKQFTVGVELTF